MNLTKELQHLLGFISTYKIYGIIHLGMVLHISISAILTIILLRFKVKFRNVYLIVFMVGISKEVLDSFVINNTWQKHILDMCYDMAYPTLLLIIHRIKLKRASKILNQTHV